MEELTNKKHQRFIEEYLINGRNGTKAYMSVYPDSKEESASVNATRLLGNVKIRLYLDAQEKKITEKFQITRESMANLLLSCIKDCKEAGDRKNLISAVTTLNKMYGLNSADKVELEAKGIIINYVAPKE